MSHLGSRTRHPAVATTVIICLAVVSLAVAGCGAKPKAAMPQQSQGEQSPPREGPSSAANQGGPTDAGAYGIDIDRKVIKNAEISMDVTDLAEAIGKIEAKAEQASGFLQDSSTSTGRDERRSARVIVRVPSGRFLEVLQLVESLGKVTNRRVFSEDVTEQYTDLGSRVTNLQEQQKRLREILAQAKKIDEILQVERELERVRLECDSLSGRLRLLKSKVEMSTINVYLRETSLAGQKVSAQPLGSAWPRAASAFVSNANFLVGVGADLVVFLIGSLPTLAVVAVIAVLVLFARRKWPGRRRPSA